MTKWLVVAVVAALGWVLAPWVSMWRRGTLDEQRRRSWAQEGSPEGRIPAPRRPLDPLLRSGVPGPRSSATTPVRGSP